MIKARWVDEILYRIDQVFFGITYILPEHNTSHSVVSRIFSLELHRFLIVVKVLQLIILSIFIRFPPTIQKKVRAP